MVYPNLSRMALDYLSIPGGLLVSESHLLAFTCFLATRQPSNESFLRDDIFFILPSNRLIPSSIRAYLCLGSWGCHDMLRKEDLLAAIKCKKRKRVDSE
jgi:hypothetical protein